MTFRIITADVMDGLRQLADESVHCVVTLPPYWNLRDYGVAGQIGLEPTPDAFVARMVEVFRDVRRVLRSDGTLWLNMGDSYASGEIGRHDHAQAAGLCVVGTAAGRANIGAGMNGRKQRKLTTGLKPKDLMGMPWKVAFALQADGWWLRSEIIWSKPNPMPESVTDRPTKAHEQIFLLTKSATYFYDAEAVRGAHAEPGRIQLNYAPHRALKQEMGVRDNKPTQESPGYNPAGRNKRSVWTIATAPFPEAHFATFPPELPEICIKAGTSQHGCCAECEAPWRRETERKTVRQLADERGTWAERPGAAAYGAAAGTTQRRDKASGLSASNSHGASTPQSPEVITLGWSPSCSCNADVKPCTVLDCFSGAGTTCLVADRLQRNAIGIELNPEYAAMSIARLSKDRGGLLDFIDQPEQPKPKQLSLLEAS